MYTYTAYILRWVDGDTVKLSVDVGFRVTIEDTFRLYGINTPERGQPLYAEARLRCMELLPIGAQVTVRTYKQDKYGRWLVNIPIIRETLIAEGLAKPFMTDNLPPEPSS